MNKTMEKNINLYTKRSEDYHKKYVEYGNKKVITDTYSIIITNNVPSDYVKFESDSMLKYVEKFDNLEVIRDIDFTELETFKTKKFNNMYSIEFNIKEVKKILGIIKKSKMQLLNDKDNYIYMLRLESKNNEVAYLLPMKVF